MATNTSHIAILSKVAESLIATKRFSSAEEVYRDLALAAVRKKTAKYKSRIRRLEQKYEMDFASFTDRFKENAAPNEEDDWLAWRSARNMLSELRSIAESVLKSNGESR